MASIAYADFNVVQQLTNDTNTGSASRAHNQGLGILSPSASITGVDVIINVNTTGLNLDLEFCDNSTQNQAFNCTNAVHHTPTATIAANTTAVQHFTFSSPVINSGSKYVYIIYPAPGGSFNEAIYGSAADTYAGWQCYDTVGSCPSVADAYFAVIGSGTAPDTITLTTPVNATSTPDFGLFEGAFTTTSTTTPRFVRVFYGYSTSTMTMSDYEPHSLTNGGNESWVVQKLNQVNTGTLYAQAWLYSDDTLSYSASSSISSFTLTTSGNPYFPVATLPSSTSTIDQAYFSCDPAAGNFFTNGICNMILGLFIPPQSDFDNFGNIKARIEHKPPFGYLTSLNTAFSALSSSTTPAVDFSAVSSISFFTDLKNFLVWPLWLLFGFWVWNKFRHFKP